MDLSIVIPAYNEVESVGVLYDELKSVLAGLVADWEIIFVDDGSTDGTAEALRALSARDHRVRIVRFRQNAGQTAAIDAGFRLARGEAVVTMDADLQNDPQDIPLLLAGLSRFDVVCGWRHPRQDPWIRRVSSSIANLVRNRVTNESIHDIGCSLKAYRKICLDHLKLYRGMHRFLPTLLRLDGRSVTEVKVHHRPRLYGQSKYNIRNRLFVGLVDLFAVRWMVSRRLDYEIEEVL